MLQIINQFFVKAKVRISRNELFFLKKDEHLSKHYLSNITYMVCVRTVRESDVFIATVIDLVSFQLGHAVVILKKILNLKF